MPPTISTYAEGTASPSTSTTSAFQIGLESIGLIIALAACVAILITGCYGPISWNNEWPLIRALPKSWKKHIYPSRTDDPPLVDNPSLSRPTIKRWQWSADSTPRSSGTLVAK